ncbi:MAG: MurR/RpiR family transcriptional regulator [Anaerococcus sp.]|nr:MurR/RpiR family transcriptional regulator [Anaerococcus sp.]
MGLHFNKDIIENMNESEIRVANFINRYIDRVYNMNIDEVAEACFVSKTSVVRASKKMGFSGFSELKYYFKNITEKPEDEIGLDYQKIRENDINNTLKIIDDVDYIKLINLLRNSRIYFFGKGLNSYICDYAVTQFLLLGFNAIHLESTHVAMTNVKYMTSKDVLFIVSMSGETRQCVNLALQAKTNDVTIISLTNATKNTLEKLASMSYYIFISDDRRVEFDNSSRIPMLLFFHKVFDEIIGK